MRQVYGMPRFIAHAAKGRSRRLRDRYSLFMHSEFVQKSTR